MMSSRRALPFVAVVLGVVLGAPAVSQAKVEPHELSSQCVGPEAKKNLAECPGGPSKFAISKKREQRAQRDARARRQKKERKGGGAGWTSAPPPPPRELKKQSDAKPQNP